VRVNAGIKLLIKERLATGGKSTFGMNTRERSVASVGPITSARPPTGRRQQSGPSPPRANFAACPQPAKADAGIKTGAPGPMAAPATARQPRSDLNESPRGRGPVA
jgi:hypothetical protein